MKEYNINVAADQKNKLDSKISGNNKSIIHLKLDKNDILYIQNQHSGITNDDNFLKSDMGFSQDFDTNPVPQSNILDSLNKVLLNSQLTPLRTLKTFNDNAMNEFTRFQNWPLNTTISCWWCRDTFSGIPCSIPEYLEDDTFYCIGCFCSFSCALAYLNDRNEADLSNKQILLQQMCCKLNGHQLDLNNIAPDWRLLKQYGGILSIEEFRNGTITINNSSYQINKLKHQPTTIQIQ